VGRRGRSLTKYCTLTLKGRKLLATSLNRTAVCIYAFDDRSFCASGSGARENYLFSGRRAIHVGNTDRRSGETLQKPGENAFYSSPQS